MADNTTETETELGIIQIESQKLINIDDFLKEDLNITSVECHFPYVTSAVSAFENCSNLDSFLGNLDNLNDGTNMFSNCLKLEDFAGKLTSLSIGKSMFYNTNLAEFTEDLPSLTDSSTGGYFPGGMFSQCENLKLFSSNMGKLTTYSGMFDGTSLNTFRTNKINTTDTGATFMSSIGLTSSKSTLCNFYCDLPMMTNTNNMFADFTSLEIVQGDFHNVISANNMFYNCKSLKTCPTDFSSLESAKMMFECSSIDRIPCSFPYLTTANQMFCECGINGHLEVNCPIQFEKLTSNVTFMFGYLPNLTSVDFDVSSISNGSQMFGNCPNLTTCTGAEFQEGGNYQSMFTESKFDQESAQLIDYYAKSANVAKLHIGIGFQLSEDHNFVKENSLIKYNNSERQWCRGELPYCVCHHTPGFICDTVQYEIANGNTSNLVENEDDSIIFVCNPN